jgi:hypothetical protein
MAITPEINLNWQVMQHNCKLGESCRTLNSKVDILAFLPHSFHGFQMNIGTQAKYIHTGLTFVQINSFQILANLPTQGKDKSLRSRAQPLVYMRKQAILPNILKPTTMNTTTIKEHNCTT